MKPAMASVKTVLRRKLAIARAMDNGMAVMPMVNTSDDQRSNPVDDNHFCNISRKAWPSRNDSRWDRCGMKLLTALISNILLI